jgi:hypothetical protein
MAERVVVLGGLGLALCTIVALGCGGSGGGGPGGSTNLSCNFTASSFCFDETVPSRLTSLELTQLQNTCTGGGTFGYDSACPTADRVGTCALACAYYCAPGFSKAPAASGVNERFYSPGNTASTAQQACTAQGGTWTAG